MVDAADPVFFLLLGDPAAMLAGGHGSRCGSCAADKRGDGGSVLRDHLGIRSEDGLIDGVGPDGRTARRTARLLRPTVFDVDNSAIGYQTFRQVAWAGSFEGATTVGLGVRARLPFRVHTLPDRIVIDVAHH